MNDIEQAARAEADRRYPELVLAPENEHYAEIFEAGASWLAEYLLSDENVEKAARALCVSTNPDAGDVLWDHGPEGVREKYREQARTALSAVLGEVES